ncbi:MAG TPA: hypothetical protein VM818_08620 [Vicinamibacterales bacterium]|jgi:hypothetical protein|nr:hypothetical protein [Vicinamibacterales bacterium]
MRNDSRPIGEDFRDIAEHHRDRERRDRLDPKGRDDARPADEPLNRETLEQPPLADRSDR